MVCFLYHSSSCLPLTGRRLVPSFFFPGRLNRLKLIRGILVTRPSSTGCVHWKPADDAGVENKTNHQVIGCHIVNLPTFNQRMTWRACASAQPRWGSTLACTKQDKSRNHKELVMRRVSKLMTWVYTLCKEGVSTDL